MPVMSKSVVQEIPIERWAEDIAAGAAHYAAQGATIEQAVAAAIETLTTYACGHVQRWRAASPESPTFRN